MNAQDSAVCSAEIGQILARLPHRYPFILVDRLLRCVPMQSSHALKNVSRNEPFFDGSDSPQLRMPQMLIIEAMAQNCALLCSLSVAKPAGATYFFAGIDKCRFGRSVGPGDQMLLEATIVRISPLLGKFHARALVAEELVAEADFIAVAAQQSPRPARE